MKTKKYRSDHLKTCHQMMEAVYKANGITVAEMREFDDGCLVSEPVLPAKPATPRKKACAAAGQ